MKPKASSARIEVEDMEGYVMTHRLRRAFALILFVFGIGWGTFASAQMADADRDAIRGTIESQIGAFQQDDGPAAYSYASPMIRQLFPSVDIFMEMVRTGYQPVYRPRSVTFGEIVETPRGPEQRVFLTGPDGTNWVAIYTLERQPDGTWKISGCRLVRDDGSIA